MLRDWGWIGGDRIAGLPGGSGAVSFGEVEARKFPLLYEAAGNFLDRALDVPALAEQWADFEAFSRDQASWLDDYALYAVLRRAYNKPEVRGRSGPSRCDAAMGRRLPRPQPNTDASARLRRCCNSAFSRQWNLLKAAAEGNGIRIMGDVAIFVNMDSADVWVHPEIFELDQDLKPIRVAGVPPDYFSATGQRWGNPLYRWDVLAERGLTGGLNFAWWIGRIRRAVEIYDIVRLDHFRGFEAYWAIPAEEETGGERRVGQGPRAGAVSGPGIGAGSTATGG